MHWIELVDTAIKIGFGAFIAGVAAYVTQRMNHQKLAQSEAVQTEKELLLTIVTNFDKYLRTLNDFHGVLDGVRISVEKFNDLDDEEWDDLWAHVASEFDKLIDVGDCFTVASSRLRLLGLSQALESLEAIGEQEDKLRMFYNQLSDNKAYPRQEFLLDWHNQLRKNRDAFGEEMAKHYRSLVNPQC